MDPRSVIVALAGLGTAAFLWHKFKHAPAPWGDKVFSIGVLSFGGANAANALYGTVGLIWALH